jgi:hypothetical protein
MDKGQDEFALVPGIRRQAGRGFKLRRHAQNALHIPLRPGTGSGSPEGYSGKLLPGIGPGSPNTGVLQSPRFRLKAGKTTSRWRRLSPQPGPAKKTKKKNK